MALDKNWIPMKWPCGPLVVARRGKSQSLEAEVKETLEAWALPASLEILKGTPVNCLIVEWADGGPQDPAQQQALKPLIEAGRKLGIAFVGKIAAQENVKGLVEAAETSGLAAFMLSNSLSDAVDFPIIGQVSREKIDWDATSFIFSSTDHVWPGVALDAMHDDTANAGPTGVPWVNSNAWFSLLAREMSPGSKAWLDFDPPESSTLQRPADYSLAIADSRAYGSRWILSLDDKLRGGISRKDAQALEIWNKISGTISFFESHKGWEAFEPQGILAVVSDFQGDNAFLGNEVLNLLNRRLVQFKIVRKSRWASASTEDLRAILWVDKEPPGGEQRAKLLRFAQQGGLVIAQSYWGPADIKPFKKDPAFEFNMYNVGQGQIAVAEEPFADPYQVAVDTHLLVSRRNDLVRLFNPEETNCHSSLAPDGRRRLVQVLNYSTKPAEYVTLWVDERCSSAQLLTLGAEDPATVKGAAGNPGTEFDLPTFSVYCALEMEGKNL